MNDVGYIEEQSYERWRNVMSANLDGYWLACQAAGRQFVKQPAERGRSKVVVVSSTRGRRRWTAECRRRRNNPHR